MNSDAGGAVVFSGIAAILICYLIYDIWGSGFKYKSSRLAFFAAIFFSYSPIFRLINEVIAKPIIGLQLDMNEVAKILLGLLFINILIFVIAVIYKRLAGISNEIVGVSTDRNSSTLNRVQMPKSVISESLVERFEDKSSDMKGVFRSDAFDENLYAQVADEIDGKNIDKGLWTKILVKNDGDEQKTKIEYLRERVKRLSSESVFGGVNESLSHASEKDMIMEKIRSAGYTMKKFSDGSMEITSADSHITFYLKNDGNFLESLRKIERRI